NVLFDTWVHPLMMGLEEHLLGMFRNDFEFHDGAAPSHLGSHAVRVPADVTSATGSLDPLVRGDDVVRGDDSLLADDGVRGDDGLAIVTPANAAVHAGVTTDPAAAANVVVTLRWAPEAEAELRKIPFFVRPKARRNTERYAAERGVADISLDTLYEAKAHYAR
ncbi:MAG TPA: hypothetical protein VGD56_09855, partial [Gemmatirosa sp.]